MIHLKRDYETYLKFILEIKKFTQANFTSRKLLQNIQIIATDDDSSIYNAFKDELPKTSFALCFVHLHRNVLSILDEFDLLVGEKV